MRPNKRAAEGLAEWEQSLTPEERERFFGGGVGGASLSKTVRPDILKGSAKRIPKEATETLEQLGSSAVTNLPAASGGPVAFGGAVAADMALNQIFPPTSSELRAQGVGGLAEWMLSKNPKIKALGGGSRALVGMLAGGAAVGAEQAGEVALGTQSKGGAIASTLAVGMLPPAMQEGLGALGRRLSGRTEANLQTAFDDVVDTLDEFGVAAKSGGQVMQTINELGRYMPFASDVVASRDRRLTAAAFKKFAKEELSPDVSIGSGTARPGERAIEDISDEAADFLENATRFGGQITPPQRAAVLGALAQDAGEIASNIGTKANKLKLVRSMRDFVPLEDQVRLKNAWVNEHIIGPAIDTSTRGVNVDKALGSAVTRDAPGELISVNPATLSSNLKNVNAEKMFEMMKLGGAGDAQARESVEALKAISDALKINSVRLGPKKDDPFFMRYLANKYAFSTLAIGATQIDELSDSHPSLRFLESTKSIAAGVGILVSAGTLLTLGINNPRVAKNFTSIVENGPKAIGSFMRSAADAGYTFEPVPNQPGQVQVVEPRKADEAAKDEVAGSPATIQDFLQLSPR